MSSAIFKKQSAEKPPVNKILSLKRHVKIQASKKQTNADLLLTHLSNLGVKYIFGIPGGAIQPFYNAMLQQQIKGGIRSITARHESGASFMADGYARESGTIGVCCATTGPGATNLVSGVSSAYENEIPQLVITAQTAMSTFGKGSFQDSSDTSLDILGIFKHCTRYNSLVSHPEQLEHKLFAALRTAFRYPQGPVHLSIPVDILEATVTHQRSPIDLKEILQEDHLLDTRKMQQLIKRIKGPGKTVLLIGAGCKGVGQEILTLAETLQADVVGATDAKGFVNEKDKRFKGLIGFAGHASAKKIIDSAGLIIALGTNFSDWATGGAKNVAVLNDKLVHLDANIAHFDFSAMAKMHIQGNIKEMVVCLNAKIRDKSYSFSKFIKDKNLIEARQRISKERNESEISFDETHKMHSNASPIKPQRLMKELGNRLPKGSRFLADTGNSFAWATHYLQLNNRKHETPLEFNPEAYDENNPFYACANFACMGWAIGAAIGISLANKNDPVVCITGDGSFLMNGQEITVAKKERLPIIYIILNDGALGMVKHGQKLSGFKEYACHIPEVDFQKLAESMYISAYTVRSPEDLSKIDFEKLARQKGPTLLDVRIDASEVPPMGMRVESLQNTK